MQRRRGGSTSKAQRQPGGGENDVRQCLCQATTHRWEKPQSIESLNRFHLCCIAAVHTRSMLKVKVSAHHPGASTVLDNARNILGLLCSFAAAQPGILIQLSPQIENDCVHTDISFGAHLFANVRGFTDEPPQVQVSLAQHPE